MFSCENWKNFKNTYFIEHLWTAASDGSESVDSKHDSWFMIRVPNLKFHKQIFLKKQKKHKLLLFHELKFIQTFLRQHYILHKKWINNKPVYGLLSIRNNIFLVYTPAWLYPGPTTGRGITTSHDPCCI